MSQQTIFCINSGNTNTTLALVNVTLRQCIGSITVPTDSLHETLVETYTILTHDISEKIPVALATVSKQDSPTLSRSIAALSKTKSVAIVNGASPLPFTIAYNPLLSLGADRIADGMHAYIRHPKKNVIIIDCGTAVTINMLSADATFRGGYILPGVATQRRALFHHTALLPEINSSEKTFTSIPASTTDAIIEGTMISVIGGIEHGIRKLMAHYPDAIIMAGGGGWNALAPHFSLSIDSVENMTIIGIALCEDYRITIF